MEVHASSKHLTRSVLCRCWACLGMHVGSILGSTDLYLALLTHPPSMRRVAKDRWRWGEGGALKLTRSSGERAQAMTKCHAALGWAAFESRGLSCNSDPEETEAGYASDSWAKNSPHPRPCRQVHLCSDGPLLTSLSTSSPQVPSAMNAESFFCEEMLSWDFSAAAARCSVVTDHGAWSLFVFSASLISFPHLSTIISRCGREGGREGASGQRRRCVLETTTRRHTEEDSRGASDSQREADRGGKKTILSLSLLGFFVLFHSLCWQSGMTPCYWQEAVHVTIPTFS